MLKSVYFQIQSSIHKIQFFSKFWMQQLDGKYGWMGKTGLVGV